MNRIEMLKRRDKLLEVKESVDLILADVIEVKDEINEELDEISEIIKAEDEES